MYDEEGKLLWQELYLPFGERYNFKSITKNDKVNKHWFAGKEQDATGLNYFGARYYSSDLGRFISPDPVAVDPENPASFNRYAYGNNNPYKYVDPDGRTAAEWFNDFVNGVGDGSSFGAFGESSYKYESAHAAGVGVGIGSWFTGAGEAYFGLKGGGVLLSTAKGFFTPKFKLSFSELKVALKSASEGYKGSTKLGHALSKHGNRKSEIWGKTKGAMDTWHEQAMKHFRDIYRGPGGFKREINDNGITFLEKRLSDGRGIRLNRDKTFKGFID